jgi:hypothetical protein
VHAVLKSLDLEPDPSTLSADPAEFSLLARMYVGPPDTSGEESFDVTVCTPEWIAEACRQHGGIYNPRHHLVVNFDQFDKRVLASWLAARVRAVQGESWAEIGERLGRLALWEFEEYRD